MQPMLTDKGYCLLPDQGWSACSGLIAFTARIEAPRCGLQWMGGRAPSLLPAAAPDRLGSTATGSLARLWIRVQRANSPLRTLGRRWGRNAEPIAAVVEALDLQQGSGIRLSAEALACIASQLSSVQQPEA